MAYDEGLAQRLRDALIDEREVTEKKMFGGLCLLIGGKMCLGIVGEELMVHVGDAYANALKRDGARKMDFTGRPMKGMVFVSAEGIESETALEEWVRMGVASARARSAPKRRPVGR
jgi:TfoX/Sxy family transcriptional regulator of competence genes